MSDSRPIPLHLTPARLADFCRQLRQRTPDHAQALQVLTTLQAFLGMCVEDRNHPSWLDAQRELEALIEELRADLIAQHAAQLGAALREHDTAIITRSFMALSRSGFAAAVASAWTQLEAQARSDGLSWLNAWTHDARQRAGAASRYPDAPDFHAVGIGLETYLALEELRGIMEKLDNVAQ
jgi:hypothetical protein